MVRPPCMHKCSRPTPALTFFRDTNMPAKGRTIPFPKTTMIKRVARVRQKGRKDDIHNARASEHTRNSQASKVRKSYCSLNTDFSTQRRRVLFYG